MAKKQEYNYKSLQSDYGKMPPQAVDLEEAILGSLMLEKDAFITVSDFLKPDCFYKEAHQKIYRGIQNLSLNNEPVDILTVSEEMKRLGELEEIGGYYYLAQLTSKVASAAHIEFHARIIVQKYIQREFAYARISRIRLMTMPRMLPTWWIWHKSRYSRLPRETSRRRRRLLTL